MTDSDKVDALTELLSNVIHTLEMKQYDIEDPNKSNQCEVEADDYYQQMLNIINFYTTEEIKQLADSDLSFEISDAALLKTKEANQYLNELIQELKRREDQEFCN
jgi:hypothetical protein